MFILAEAYHYTERFEKSDDMFIDLFLLDPNNYIAINNYSYYSALRKANLQDAEERMLPVIEKFPDQSGFLDTYAYILFRQGKYEAASQFIKQALENGGDEDGLIVEHYGDILYFLGKAENAVIQWQKAKELGETSDLIDKKIDDKKYYE
jgi:tetratricopeptide (TPR) repeat protein